MFSTQCILDLFKDYGFYLLPLFMFEFILISFNTFSLISDETRYDKKWYRFYIRSKFLKYSILISKILYFGFFIHSLICYYKESISLGLYDGNYIGRLLNISSENFYDMSLVFYVFLIFLIAIDSLGIYFICFYSEGYRRYNKLELFNEQMKTAIFETMFIPLTFSLSLNFWMFMLFNKLY